jgi:hypothetical protein
MNVPEETFWRRCEERDALLALVETLEWADFGPACLVCHRWKHDGHAADCKLSAALKLCERIEIA